MPSVSKSLGYTPERKGIDVEMQKEREKRRRACAGGSYSVCWPGVERDELGGGRAAGERIRDA